MSLLRDLLSPQGVRRLHSGCQTLSLWVADTLSPSLQGAICTQGVRHLKKNKVAGTQGVTKTGSQTPYKERHLTKISETYSECQTHGVRHPLSYIPFHQGLRETLTWIEKCFDRRCQTPRVSQTPRVLEVILRVFARI